MSGTYGWVSAIAFFYVIPCAFCYVLFRGIGDSRRDALGYSFGAPIYIARLLWDGLKRL